MPDSRLPGTRGGLPEIFVKKVREPRADEALRVLVDRLWPRGVAKDVADLDIWPKELTPSTELRRAVHGGEMPFSEFAASYTRDLRESAALPEFVTTVLGASGTVVLLIAGNPEAPNHADVLKDVLENAMRAS